MERQFLKKIIELECGEHVTILNSDKPNWFILKLSNGQKTFASVRLGKKAITINIDTVLGTTVEQIIGLREGISYNSTIKRDHIQNRTKIEYSQLDIVSVILREMIKSNSCHIETYKDRREAST